MTTLQQEETKAEDSIQTSLSILTQAERNLENATAVPFYKFVFTGGPCGGKTTALARVYSYLRERSFQVITVPEAWGMLNSQGLSLDYLWATEGMGTMVQGTVMDVQRAMEDGVERVLKARGEPAVLLCDRGLMDGGVYITPDEFGKILEERQLDIVQARDQRYDACFHMVTAADGAEAFYTLENNQVRTESREEAIRVDRLTQKAWLGHAHLYVLDNSTDFEGKMNRLIDIVSTIVGLPSNLKRRAIKYVLAEHPSEIPIDYQVFDVEKVYLQQTSVVTGKKKEDDDYLFIRRRSNVDKKTGKVLGSVCQITKVQKRSTTQDAESSSNIVEQKRIISQRVYDDLYKTRDVSRHIVRQRRISFLYEQQSFSVHTYVAPISNVSVLHAQVEKEDCVKLPPFLNVERKLESCPEDQKRYGAYSLSLIEREI